MQKIYFVFLSARVLHLQIKSDWTYGIKLCNLYWLAISDDIVLVIPAYHRNGLRLVSNLLFVSVYDKMC